MAAKKKAAVLKSLGKGLLIVLTVLAAFALFLSYSAKIILPSISSVIAYCGLLFPYILLVNLGFVVIWLFLDYRWALVPTLMILLNVNNIDKHFQLRAQEKPETCANCIKVMSYNARMFNMYEDNRKELNRQVTDFLKKEEPDILCVQEYFYDNSGRLGYNTTEEVLKALKLPDNNKTYKLYLPLGNPRKYQYGLAIFSRYRIVGSGVVEMNDSSANRSMYVDIRYNGDTLRIYNVHLSSMKLGSEDYATGDAMLHNNMEDPDFDRKARKLYHKIADAFEQRQHQAKCVRADMDSCTHPIIVCGDFNDSPASFSYHKIAHGLKDSFRSSGKGTGTTYAGEVFPAYRIDYILHDRQYNDFGHTVCTNLKTSDHYPVYTYISIINKK